MGDQTSKYPLPPSWAPFPQTNQPNGGAKKPGNFSTPPQPVAKIARPICSSENSEKKNGPTIGQNAPTKIPWRFIMRKTTKSTALNASTPPDPKKSINNQHAEEQDSDCWMGQVSRLGFPPDNHPGPWAPWGVPRKPPGKPATRKLKVAVSKRLGDIYRYSSKWGLWKPECMWSVNYLLWEMVWC